MEGSVKAALLFGGIASLVLGGFNENQAKSALIRPPGAADEALFLSTCLRCGKCAQVCPQKAIRIGHGDKGVSIGTPYIEPRRAACNLCMDCVKVCTSGALKEIAKENARMGLAEINQDTCLAWQGDECKVCYTSCPFFNRAIRLEDHKRPVIDRKVCVGCGICEYVCITHPAAVTVKAGR